MFLLSQVFLVTNPSQNNPSVIPPVDDKKALEEKFKLAISNFNQKNGAPVQPAPSDPNQTGSKLKSRKFNPYASSFPRASNPVNPILEVVQTKTEWDKDIPKDIPKLSLSKPKRPSLPVGELEAKTTEEMEKIEEEVKKEDENQQQQLKEALKKAKNGGYTVTQNRSTKVTKQYLIDLIEVL